ncbi:uncharacterized protein [Nicotiana tomentosiformis]|uniref:uncharacterized protein isoform X1 n=2 Tax=Nicotiana tomentosiformis TaxID=4098 RepID=UPI00051CA0B0|nr:uncharacterized protein LOC104089926 isoform X1 [Nicotiana tomentosiformis]
MPGLAQKNDEEYANEAVVFNASSKSISSNGGFWSKHSEDVSYNQLQKFWSELSPQARQKILRIDKQTLFEQARKNMYCSRCNGLLLEVFFQIVMYAKSLQQEGAGGRRPCSRVGALKNHCDGELCATTGSEYDVQDPSVHPWGGLTTTRDGVLTLLDCYLHTKSLKGLQNVFDSARARERERELHYPDACGGGARGWISQGMATYGRGHGTRETCALHTTRLSVDTLVDFWTALGEETRQSLLKMKEEDFIERLMYRFDSKRFCRDCRRNVIREFKVLKELKRMRREPHCSSWFCVADAVFQYEVSHDTILADWHQAFIDTFGTYHHFEWAVGSGEGKCDILDYENVGLSGRVQVSGLDLSGLNACYITLRAWKLDGRCTELSVKAHALKGQQCVHCRLVVGDGFVTMTRGESIRRFFEHAEEAEEEEDEDSMDKDGNELDGECPRPQKHAKSPELAREFLLDAATVIFKEQVEKAFREGTARQNAHSIFVCLALKLLEERIHVACKEIVTLEKQMKLLEEEEKEKREEEERRERRRLKEKEKKLRRKERLREKEKDREKKSCDSNQSNFALDSVQTDESSPNVDEESNLMSYTDSVSEAGEVILSSPLSPNDEDDLFLDGYNHPNMQIHSDDYLEEFNMNDGSFATGRAGQSGSLKFRKEFKPDSTLKWFDGRRFTVVSGSGDAVNKYDPRRRCDNFEASRSTDRLNKQLRNSAAKSSMKDGASKFTEKFDCFNNRMYDRYDSSACSCNKHIDYRAKLYPNARGIGNKKAVSKSGSESDISKPYYGNKYNQVEYVRENCVRPKSKMAIRNNLSSRDSSVTKKVWEPMELQKKYPRSSSDSDVTFRSSTFQIESTGIGKHPEPSISNDLGVSSTLQINEEKGIQELRKSSSETISNCASGFHLEDKSLRYVKEVAEDDEVGSCLMPRFSSQRTLSLSQSSSSNSDNCSSCLSEGDSTTSFSNPHNSESSSTSDSEDCSQNSEGRETSEIVQDGFADCYDVAQGKRNATERGEDVSCLTPDSAGITAVGSFPTTVASKNANVNGNLGMRPQSLLPSVHNQGIHFPRFLAPATDYYDQIPPSWATAPANGFMPFPHPSHYVFASPFTYGLNGNTHFVQYGAQHLIPPPVNPGHLPAFQSVAPSNDNCTKENAKVSAVGRLKDAHHEANLKRMAAVGQHPMEKSTTVGAGENEKSGNSGFSLFSFTPDPFSLKEGMARNISSNLTANHVEGDSGCNKKEPIEEYNPFANRIQFSFSDIVR